MVYDRNSRDGQRDDYGRNSAGGRDYRPTGGRDYAPTDQHGRDDYGARDYGAQGARRFDQGPRDYGRQDWGGQQDDGRHDYGRQDRGDQRGYAPEAGRYRDADRDRGYSSRDRGGYGRQPQGYDYDERGFLQRAGDEVRSWFGDEDAERRREADARYEEHTDRSGGGRHDDDYRQWRHGQLSALDRDYHEYRQENRAKFENEFSTWRTARQGQRDQLRQVKEHAEVVGSDGAHVGTVDKVRDDRILLTKNDADAGGRHHSIPSRWIDKVEDQTVTLSKTAAEAKAAWEDEDRNSAFSGYGDNQRQNRDTNEGGRDAQGRLLNRSFSGTY